MMKFLGTTCRKATLLLSKKEENRLTWLETLRLRGHLAICSMCRKFEEQTGFIVQHAKHFHADAVLPAQAKEKIRTLLKD
jgi:predicted anti-sigma-YlaC factor YlaD